MAFTYTDDPENVARDAVRLWAGDITQDPNASASDAEVDYFLSRYGIDPSGKPEPEVSILRAASDVATTMAHKWARYASYTVGGLGETANEKAKESRANAKELKRRADASAIMRVGGRSISEKETAADDEDAVQPFFERDRFTTPGLKNQDDTRYPFRE